MMRLNLRAKVLIFTMAIIVILLITSHLLTRTLVARSLQEQLDRRAARAVENLNEWVSARKQQIYNTTQLLAASDWMRNAAAYEAPNWVGVGLRHNLRGGEPDLLMIESTSGGWVYQVVDRPLRYGGGLPRRAFELPEQRWHGGLTEVVPDGDRLILTVGVPVRSGREVLGLLTLGFAIDASAIESMRYACGSDELTVLSEDGLLLTTFPDRLNAALSAALPGELDARVPDELEIGNEKFLTRVQPLSSTGGRVVAKVLVQFSDRESQELLANISNALNLSALGAFVVFSFLAVVFSGRATKKLNRLVEHVSALGEGRYEEPVEVTAKDEVGVLARSFERLRVRLKERTDELVSANVELDRGVREIGSLNRVMVAIASNLPMELVFATISREAGKHLPVDYSYLALQTGEEQGMRLLAWHAEEGSPQEAPPLRPGASLAEAVAVSGEALEKESLLGDSDRSDESWMAGRGLRSAYFLPLLSEGTSIGSLCLAGSGHQRLDENVRSFLQRLATEITVALQRMRLNEELQLIESRLSRLFDSVRDGIFQTDPQGNIVFVNAAGQAMFGSPAPGTGEGLNLEEMFVEESEREQLLSRLREYGYVTNFSAMLARSDGSGFDAELSVNFTDDEESRRGIEGIIRDVTQRKSLERELQRSEAFLRQLVEETTNAIFVLDTKGRITFMNPQLSGLTGEEENMLQGRPFEELVDPEDRETCRAMIEGTLNRGERAGGCELKLLRADGGALEALISLAPLTERRAERAAVGAIADITEIKKLERQLLRSERLASMGQIAAGVAHEINNPLGIVLGFTQDLLAGKGEDDADREALMVIEHETERCARIVKDLLNLARADEATREPLDLKQVLRKTLRLFTIHLRTGGITLKTRYGKTPPVLGDEQQLQQVFMNVILNSIHAMENGGELRVSLRSGGGPHGGGGVEVRIEDNGVGIEDDDLQRIFDPFFSTKKGSGSGLGLFIVHRLVDAHGGRVNIESTVGQGTVCTITLPAAVDEK